jgi:Ca2+-binding RTX toxin-like protein
MATINGNNGNNLLIGTLFADTINGFGGNDRLFGLAGNDHLDGGSGFDQLFGAAGKDFLYGRAGNDLLDGGLGADRMEGGLGNDLFVVDNIGDQAFELANQGVDTVRSSLTFTLGAHIENLLLVGSGAISGFGNSQNNRLIGNNANNVLSDPSLSSTDVLDGRGGNDHLFSGRGNDLVLGGAGLDRLDGGRGNDNLVGGTGNDFLFGGEVSMPLSGTDNDRLNGGTGNDTLIGGFGADILTGGAGADTFAYQNQGQSNPSPFSGVDLIVDFDRSEGDKINLRLIDAKTTAPGDQAFTFIGTAPFTVANAEGQLRIQVVGGETIVQGSTDFNEFTVEFQLRVRGDVPNLASDYIL